MMVYFDGWWSTQMASRAAMAVGVKSPSFGSAKLHL
ncbi:hypothetical protein GGQ95_000976 [Anoxybacillus rupiensis]|nr:hypothetical protein [Anoxybacillus rupiensis]